MQILTADLEHLDQLSILFDAYRQFYRQASNPQLCRDFLQERLSNNQSTIFLARQDGGDTALGFTQLYPSFCSVSATPIFILYDLYVDSAGRRQGVARALMETARAYASRQGASRLDLETAIDNHQAQALYEGLGYEREQHFYEYSLDLNT